MMLHQPLWLTDLAAYSFQVALIVIVGSLLPPLLRLRAPRVRLMYWQVLLAACLLLPLVEPWRPELSPLGEIGDQVSVSVGSAVAAAGGWPFSPAEVVLAVLLAGVLFRAMWISLGLRRLRVYRVRARPLSEKLAPVEEARRLTSASPAILLSSELQTPATFGLLSPAVLLPERFFQLAGSQQKAIICHELLHVARRDWTWNMAEELVLTLFWFHPALWWAVRNIRLSREQTVDAEVVRRTQSRQAYLSALLEMAQRDLCCGSVPAPLFLREGQLSERVSLMVKEVSMSRFRLVATCFAAAAALMLTGAAAVWAFPLRIPTGAPDKVAIQSRIPGGIEAGVEDRPSLHLRAVIQNGAAPRRVDVKQLRVVRSVMPHYPAEAKNAGIQGTVRLDVLISKKGDVTEVRLISGPSALVKSAENAVKQWRYAPSPLLPARTRIEIHYTLADTPSAPPKHSSATAGPPPISASRSSAGTNNAFTTPGGVLHEAVPTYSPAPPYTPEAHKDKLSGDVVLSVVVSDKGSVISDEVVKPLGKGLDESALKTVRTWKFKPGELNGKPVPVRMLIDVTFHIDGGMAPAASK